MQVQIHSRKRSIHPCLHMLHGPASSQTVQYRTRVSDDEKSIKSTTQRVTTNLGLWERNAIYGSNANVRARRGAFAHIVDDMLAWRAAAGVLVLPRAAHWLLWRSLRAQGA
jgi:hypothetical protein